MEQSLCAREHFGQERTREHRDLPQLWLTVSGVRVWLRTLLYSTVFFPREGGMKAHTMVASPATVPQRSWHACVQQGIGRSRWDTGLVLPPAGVCMTQAPSQAGAGGLCRKAGDHMHAERGDSLTEETGSSPAPSSRQPLLRKTSPRSPHRSQCPVTSVFYYFTVVANKSRCKQGLFHINILTGLSVSNK